MFENVEYLKGEILKEDEYEKYNVFYSGNVEESIFKHCERAINNCISVYTALSDDDDAPLIIDQIQDEVAQEEIDKLPEILFFSYLHNLESEAIDKLTDKEKTVTKAINGFESAVYSINELAEMFGVSYSRIQELKDNSYRKLRRNKKIKNVWETEFLYR